MKLAVSLATFLLMTLSMSEASAQAHVGLIVESQPEQRQLSSTLVVGLATLNTVVPIAIGVKLLHDENAEVFGAALLGWGWIVGPAPFSLYYRDTTAGLVGLGIRGASVLVAAAVTSGGTWDEDGSPGTEIVLMSVMSISVLSAVLNIVGLPAAMQRFYAQDLVSLAPIIVRNGAGLRLSVRL